MTIATPRPPHRIERLRGWMDDEKIDCTVVFGTDNVNHLCGYWRYFGGPSALVIGRDGERTLVVMLDEAPIAETLSAADRGARASASAGSGSTSTRSPDSSRRLAAVPDGRAGEHAVGVASEIPGADARLERRRCPLSSSTPDRRSTGSGWSRTGTSSRRSTPAISSAGSARRRSPTAQCPA